MSGRHPQPPRPSQPPASDSHTPLSIEAAIERGAATLAERAGPEARAEALYLLSGLLDLSPGRMVLEGNRPLDLEAQREYSTRLARRAAGEPLQYIEGQAAFRELQLAVSPSVLIPRPETEGLVGLVLDWASGRAALSALDMGTGSGAIAISLALEGPFQNVVAVDISAEALNVARENAVAAGVAGRIDFRHGSLFGALIEGQRFHVIASNPPYVASGEAASLPEEVRDWEPAAALYAGPTGLEVIEEIVERGPDHLEPSGLLAVELAPGLADTAVERVRARGAYREPRIVRDLAGRRRALLAERRDDAARAGQVGQC